MLSTKKWRTAHVDGFWSFFLYFATTSFVNLGSDEIQLPLASQCESDNQNVRQRIWAFISKDLNRASDEKEILLRNNLIVTEKENRVRELLLD